MSPYADRVPGTREAKVSVSAHGNKAPRERCTCDALRTAPTTITPPRHREPGYVVHGHAPATAPRCSRAPSRG